MALRKGAFDKNVIILIGFVIVIAGGILLFRALTRKSCPEAKFSILNQEETYKVGNPVYFRDNTEGANSWNWDFGDSTHSAEANPQHVFEAAGEYTVWLYVDDCAEGTFVKVKVVPAEIPVLETILPIGGIVGPENGTANAGVPVTFKDTSSVATSWEWSFGESGVTDATEKEPKYTFKQPGKHTVTLVINGAGKSRTATYEIFVKPKPASSGPKIPVLSEQQFIAMLQKIIDHEAKGASIFSVHMNGYTNQPIKVNGVEKIFDSYCTGLYLSGKRKLIKAVRFDTDKNGYISNVEITETTKTD